MSTRSLIGIRENDSVRYIYCHHDGYLDGVGKMLVENYNKPDKINELIDSGDHTAIYAEPNAGSYVSLGDDWEDVKPCTVMMSTWTNDVVKDTGIDYSYLWDNGKWYAWNLSGKKIAIDF